MSIMGVPAAVIFASFGIGVLVGITAIVVIDEFIWKTIEKMGQPA